METLKATLYGLLCYKKPFKIVMVGIRASGKTQILYKLVAEEFVTTIPSMGFNVERYKFEDHDLEIWDIGYGGGKLGPIWRGYYADISGIIWVVDAADSDELENSRQELWDYVLKTPEIENSRVPLLVFANKQDLPNVLTTSEISDALKLSSCPTPHHIVGCSALTGEGIKEGLEWLIQQF